MAKKKNINRKLNVSNLFISIFVSGTGLILFTQFHIGDGAHQKEWLGLEKNFWLIIHQASAIGFFAGFVIHIQMHWKYIKTVAKQWRIKLPKKIKSKTFEQIMLLMATLIVLGAGFYPWIVMPGATLETEVFHKWIDVHNRVGIFFLIGMGVHVKRRWRRIIRFTKRNSALESNAFPEPTDRRPKPIMKADAMRSNRNRTEYIWADTSKCKACWECIDECRHGALGKVNIWFHKHVVIKNAEKCRGCKSCIAVCPNGVFEAIAKVDLSSVAS